MTKFQWFWYFEIIGRKDDNLFWKTMFKIRIFQWRMSYILKMKRLRLSRNFYNTTVSEYEYGHYMKIEDFRDCCETGGFIDYDGHGYACKGLMLCSDISILPSMVKHISGDADAVVWFNK